jgi:hypothetical protein
MHSCSCRCTLMSDLHILRALLMLFVMCCSLCRWCEPALLMSSPLRRELCLVDTEASRLSVCASYIYTRLYRLVFHECIFEFCEPHEAARQLISSQPTGTTAAPSSILRSQALTHVGNSTHIDGPVVCQVAIRWPDDLLVELKGSTAAHLEAADRFVFHTLNLRLNLFLFIGSCGLLHG